MNITEQVNVTLEQDDIEAIADGDALQVPLNENRMLVIHPPRESVAEVGPNE